MPLPVSTLLARWHTSGFTAFTIFRGPEPHSRSRQVPAAGGRAALQTGWSHVCSVPGLQKLYILGGEVAESAQKCTHLIASKVTRTVKFLTAISVVKHIVTPEWLEECFKCQKFVGEGPSRASGTGTQLGGAAPRGQAPS